MISHKTNWAVVVAPQPMTGAFAQRMPRSLPMWSHPLERPLVALVFHFRIFSVGKPITMRQFARPGTAGEALQFSWSTTFAVNVLANLPPAM